MKTIYVFTNGTVLRRVGRRLLLEQKQTRLFDIPLKEVSRILIYSRTEVTGQTITALLESGISLHYLRRSGNLRGKLIPALDGKISLRRLQHLYCNSEEFCLQMARDFITCKINNMKTILIYIYRNAQGTSQICQPLTELNKKLIYCKSREEIMGIEGAAARHYFQHYGNAFPDVFRFKIRSRRPATDPTNALLNLGYMSLMREVMSHLEAHCLDPYLGFLHADVDGRPSLALDMMEQFRQPFIDLFILKTLNLNRLTSTDFVQETNSATMTDKGIRKFFQLYEQHLGEQDGESPGIRHWIDEQIIALKKYLQGKQKYTDFQLTTEPSSIQPFV